MCGITASVALPSNRIYDEQPQNPYEQIKTEGRADFTQDGECGLETKAREHSSEYKTPNGLTNSGLTNGYDHHDDANGGDTVVPVVNGHTTKTKSSGPGTLRSQLQASIDALEHRGPDESGVWISPDGRIGLGHCRLTINDLSPRGSQPLVSNDGQIHAVVNGEIYDHDRLRQVCADHGYQFHGESDSELVLALYKIHGAPGFLDHLRGEFAFVLYDSREGRKRVIAARDRYGIKPLVWTVARGRLLLAAESKAFLPMGWEPEWDVGAIVDAGWMLDDRTLFKGVKKLLPGHYMEVTEEHGVQTHVYWDAEYQHKAKVEMRTVDDMVRGVRERLKESIRVRMRADVPVGIYLSGGIDSSAVAGIVNELAQEESVKMGSQSEKARVACFAVGFPRESGYDESQIAERTADWLGVDLFKKEIDETSLARDFADTAYHCEHHHFDFNCVAKFALSTLPREHGIKVVLTGEGADEHFAGYPYFPEDFLREPDRSLPNSPLATNHKLRDGMQAAVENEMRNIFRNIGAGEHEGPPNTAVQNDANGNGMPKTLLVWHATSELFAPWVRERYRNLDCRDTVMSSVRPQVRSKMRTKWHALHTSQYLWNKGSLANTLLSCLGDRTEMAHSIEARTPYLDHNLTEYVNSLPPSLKLAYTPPHNQHEDEGSSEFEQGPLWKDAGSALQSLTEKWVLREAVRPYITDELYARRKHPFLAPTKWPTDGPLHRMFRDLLTRDAVEGLGFLDYAVVEDALGRSFGDYADPKAFRMLAYVGAWVTLAQRFGVKKASKTDLVR